MNTYTTYDHIEQDVDQVGALDVLYNMCWGGVETSVQELSNAEYIADADGVSMYLDHDTDSYFYVDDEA